ncbi:MAG TPA: hypothetical protein VIN06_07600 [Devosia sp.]
MNRMPPRLVVLLLLVGLALLIGYGWSAIASDDVAADRLSGIARAQATLWVTPLLAAHRPPPQSR